VHPPLAELGSLPALTTERLRLRPLTAADAPALFEVFSDPEVMRYWSTPPHAQIARTEAMIASVREGFADRSALQWGIERTRDRALLGTVTLLPAGEQPRAEFGYILGRSHWGQGYAGEAQRAVIDFAFGELRMHRLEADTHPENAASLRSLERLGFRSEGLLRERWLVADAFSDSVILGLLAGEWAPGGPGRPHL
jgi:[ribosomal protein S5]-alanine N-acetyltransferase